MLKSCQHPEWVQGLRHGATQWAAKFTWDATAQATREGYSIALGQKKRVLKAA